MASKPYHYEHRILKMCNLVSTPATYTKQEQYHVVHTGPKANTNKTLTSRFTWFPLIGYVHGGNILYII